MGLDQVEASAATVASAGHPALVADLERPLPFRDGSLDGVTLIEAIEHVVAAEALVDELHRVLRPGGWLVLTTPNVAHLNYRVRAVTGHPPKQEGYHVRFFTRATLEAMLSARGFTREADASYGRVPLVSRLLAAGRGRGRPFVVPAALQSLLAKHFVWRLRRA
jgi:SAM-dependent methyltransferase